MEELVLKLDNLMNQLDSWDVACHIKDLNSKILEDDELQELLNEYSVSNDDDIKNKILNHPLFVEYKEYETEINLFIMSFNNKIKDLTKKDGCI